MDYDRITNGILDIGADMIESGAEISSVEDSIYKMLDSYGFHGINCWAIYSNIQVTAESPEGKIITQIRNVSGSGMNFDRLEYLNSLSEKVCKTQPDAPELEHMLDEVLSRPPQPRWMRYLAGVMSGAGFAVFFGCDFTDAIVAALASIIIIAIGELLEKHETNPLIYNAITAFFAVSFIILAVKAGLGHNGANITVGVSMLLISAIGFTNGIRDLLHRNTLSGIIGISNSLIGATGISIGVVLPIIISLLLKGVM